MYSLRPSKPVSYTHLLAFTFQIYFDFAGYSDMAIGLGKMFGFTLPENFNYPYISQSVSEFWRRWHITLGTWFREYVYIPLGGNRGGQLKTIRNLAIVWMLTGFWHGASWNFVLWGAYYGVLIICEKLFLKKLLDKLPKIVQQLYSFLAACIGWVFFSYTDVSQIPGVLAALFGFSAQGGADQLGMYSLLTFGPLLLLAALCAVPFVHNLTEMIRRKGTVGKVVWCAGFMALFIVLLTFLVNSSYSAFLYAKF